MIQDAGGAIDYDARGAGPTIVLVPGSCSTGAAWRPIIEAWGEPFRTVTTSLLATHSHEVGPLIARHIEMAERDRGRADETITAASFPA